MKKQDFDDLQLLDLDEEQVHNELEEIKKVPRKKSPKALIAYFVYLFILLAAAAAFLLYARKVIREYDALHPDTYLAAELEDLSRNGFSQEELALCPIGPFDEAQQIYDEVNATILGKELTAKFKSEDFTTNTLKYYVYADGEKVTEIYLTALDSFTKLHVFQMSHYEVDAMNPPMPKKAEEAIRVTMPEGYQLFLNGKEVAGAYKTETKEVEELAYCKEYVDSLPLLETYEVTEVYSVRQVEVKDQEGNVKYSWNGEKDNETYAVDVALSYEESDAPEAFQNMVFGMVKDYADFFSGDLPGCVESVDCIRYMFPADSMYLTLAEQYRREERRNFTSHSDNHYTDERMDGFIRYSEDLIVCHVTMNKHMNVWGKLVIDEIDTIYYLVKDGDRYVIADMQ